MTNFPAALVAAASARGSMLAVAERLGVAPQTVYLWIAGLEVPEKEQQVRLLAVLGPVQPAATRPSAAKRHQHHGSQARVGREALAIVELRVERLRRVGDVLERGEVVAANIERVLDTSQHILLREPDVPLALAFAIDVRGERTHLLGIGLEKRLLPCGELQVLLEFVQGHLERGDRSGLAAAALGLPHRGGGKGRGGEEQQQAAFLHGDELRWILARAG